MTQITLPPVAKSFFTFCKNCNAERYHKVLAHTSSKSAKIECEVCHSKKSYSLPKTGGVKKATTSGKGSGPRKTHSDQYNQLMMNRGSEKGLPFNIRSKYELDQKIDHPKFGSGFVTNVLVDRVDVIFQDEVKTLMHNKT